MGLRDVGVEERPRPEIRPDEVLARGQPLRRLRLRPALPPRVGRARTGAIEGHEYIGTVAAVGDAVTGWAVGDRVVGGPIAAVRRVRVLPRAAGRRCASSAGRVGADDGDWQGAFAALQDDSRRPAAARPRRTSRRSTPRSPNRWRSRCTASPRAAAPGRVRAGSSPAADRSASSPSPRCKALGVDDIVVSEPHERRRALCETARRAHGRTRTSSRRRRCRTTSSTSRSTSRSSAPGNDKAMEAALAQLKRAGHARARRRGHPRARSFDPNRILLNELVITGAFVYDDDGFARALELLASGKLPDRPARRAGGLPARRSARRRDRAARRHGSPRR